MITLPEIGDEVVCVRPVGRLEKDRRYVVADKRRTGRTWFIEVEGLPGSWWDVGRFTEVRGG